MGRATGKSGMITDDPGRGIDHIEVAPSLTADAVSRLQEKSEIAGGADGVDPATDRSRMTMERIVRGKDGNKEDIQAIFLFGQDRFSGQKVKAIGHAAHKIAVTILIGVLDGAL